MGLTTVAALFNKIGGEKATGWELRSAAEANRCNGDTTEDMAHFRNTCEVMAPVLYSWASLLAPLGPVGTRARQETTATDETWRTG